MSDFNDFGKRFGKPDIERLGLFSEMSYMHGKGYVPIRPGPILHKGTNFVGRGSKSKSGTQDGYFDDEFKRLFVGEAINRKEITKADAINNTPFVINTVAKKHATPGDNYGTFTKSMHAFSPLRKPPPPYEREPPNFLWRSGKIGGPGYADTGLDKYPNHLPDPYGLKQEVKEYGRIMNGPFHYANYPTPYFGPNPFHEDPLPTTGIYIDKGQERKRLLYGEWIPTGPAKWSGGSHAGCFDKFPQFQPCKYFSTLEANEPTITDKHVEHPFIPIPQMMKTLQTTSVVNHSVDVFMHAKNYKTYVPCYIHHLLPDKTI